MIISSLDFETANHSDASICAVGLAVFEDGVLTDSSHRLIRPPKGHGWFREDFTECHGISWSDVRYEPEFSDLAEEVLAVLCRGDLVIAHNAPFDMRKLFGTLTHFGLACPTFPVLCTLFTSRKVWPTLPSHGLGMLAAHIGHQFRHHNALDDAEAAGRLLYAMVKDAGLNSPTELMQQFGLLPGQLSSQGYTGCSLRA